MILLVVPICKGGVVTRTQCSSLPYYCPQWCMSTNNGCTVCDCSKYSSIGMVSGMSGLGAVSGTSGLSMINPASMIGFGSGNSQPSPVLGKFNSNLPGGFNSASSGMSNPFLTGSTGSDPSNPNSFGNPANLGMAAGAGVPSNPGGSSAVGGGKLQQTGQSGSQGPISQSGSGTGSVQQMTTKQIQSTKHSAIQTTTSTKSTTPSPTVSTSPPQTTKSGTCAPLRCTPPCDQGVVIAPDGCPMCLCQP